MSTPTSSDAPPTKPRNPASNASTKLHLPPSSPTRYSPDGGGCHRGPLEAVTRGSAPRRLPKTTPRRLRGVPEPTALPRVGAEVLGTADPAVFRRSRRGYDCVPRAETGQEERPARRVPRVEESAVFWRRRGNTRGGCVIIPVPCGCVVAP